MELLLLLLLPVMGGFYLLPTIIAIMRKHHQITAIVILNLFAGWTFIGWIIALVWAATTARRDS